MTFLLNSQHFFEVNDNNLKEITKDFKESIYAIDDDSAIVVTDDNIEVISERTWKKFD